MCLRPDEHLASVHAVNDDAGVRREKERGNLPGEADGAEHQRRLRELIDEPRGCDARHPGADERNGLAGEEETEISMLECAPRVGDSCGGRRFIFFLRCCVRWGRHALLI